MPRWFGAATLCLGLAWAAPAPAGSARLTTAPDPPLLGRIEVPRLGLEAPVREGADDDTLRIAVGHIQGTSKIGAAGNAGLAAHRNTFFKPLKGVKVGDVVTVTTTDGVFSYRVQKLSVVLPTEVSVLAATPDETLTLVTCYPFDWVGEAPQRLIVKAVREEAKAEATRTEALR
jgi:sortase A